MPGTKRKQRRKNPSRSNLIQTTIPRYSHVKTKNFEVFVTDFLIDPCGLPMELRDYVLVDGTNSSKGFYSPIKSSNMQIDYLEMVSNNNNQVLKNIFANTERSVSNANSFEMEENCN